MSAEDLIRRREDELRQLVFEAAFAVDQRGRTIISKTGDATEITLTDAEIELLRSAEGAIFTHNHPRGWNFPPHDPRHGGNSFSPDDIRLACRAQLAEIRAVTPLFRFSMKPPSGGWNEEFWRTVLESTFEQALQQVSERLMRAAWRGAISPLQYIADQYHETWLEVANLLGLRYSREED